MLLLHLLVKHLLVGQLGVFFVFLYVLLNSLPDCIALLSRGFFIWGRRALAWGLWHLKVGRLAHARLDLHTTLVVVFTMKPGEFCTLLILHLHALVLNQTMVLIVTILSCLILQCLGCNNICDSSTSMIDSLLCPSQLCKLDLIMAAKSADGCWPCPDSLLLFFSLYATLLDLLVILLLAVLAPLESHLLRLLFLLHHLADAVLLKAQRHCSFCLVHLSLHITGLLVLVVNLGAVLLARLLRFNLGHYSLVLVILEAPIGALPLHLDFFLSQFLLLSLFGQVLMIDFLSELLRHEFTAVLVHLFLDLGGRFMLVQ